MKDKKLTIRVTTEQREALKSEADELGATVAQLFFHRFADIFTKWRKK